jgi:hypothetical protein
MTITEALQNLAYQWHRNVLCRIGHHYHKFDTYPHRGQCIYCHHQLP